MRILIPTDFSKNALNATFYALDLYEKQHCDFYFLHVFNLDSFGATTLVLPEPGGSAYDSTKVASEASFAKLLKLLALHKNSKHTYHTAAALNYLSVALKEIIAKKDINLVVMGTKGATGAKGVIFGSNTVKTMEKITECPVLAVPENVRFSPLKEIVFPTDFKKSYNRKEMAYLIAMAHMHHAMISILHIKKTAELSLSQEENKQLLANIFKTVECSFHTLENIGLAQGISIFVASRNSDMIAFINRKHFFFNSVFSKPLIKEIAYEATTPILALH